MTLDGCDDDSRKISVVQFLDEKYKITLKYRRVPTLSEMIYISAFEKKKISYQLK